VALHGPPDQLAHDTLHDLLTHVPVILPTEPNLRAGFISLTETLGISPRIAAEVDDMAMVRLLAREGIGLALAPAVVVQDELAAGRLRTAPFDLNISEDFFAIARRRSYPHPLLGGLFDAVHGN
jgi:LysR family transcriptional activator of nhaA